MLWCFKLLLEEKVSQDLPETSISQFSEKNLASNFALLEAGAIISGPLNKNETLHLLFLGAPFVICQKLPKKYRL